jgi:hypothetical protein
MKRFMKSKFITLIKSSISSEVDINDLEKSYDDFVKLVFKEKDSFPYLNSYHESLIYTLIELYDLEKRMVKKSA